MTIWLPKAWNSTAWRPDRPMGTCATQSGSWCGPEHASLTSRQILTVVEPLVKVKQEQQGSTRVNTCSGSGCQGACNGHVSGLRKQPWGTHDPQCGAEVVRNVAGNGPVCRSSANDARDLASSPEVDPEALGLLPNLSHDFLDRSRRSSGGRGVGTSLPLLCWAPLGGASRARTLRARARARRGGLPRRRRGNRRRSSRLARRGALVRAELCSAVCAPNGLHLALGRSKSRRTEVVTPARERWFAKRAVCVDATLLSQAPLTTPPLWEERHSLRGPSLPSSTSICTGRTPESQLGAALSPGHNAALGSDVTEFRRVRVVRCCLSSRIIRGDARLSAEFCGKTMLAVGEALGAPLNPGRNEVKHPTTGAERLLGGMARNSKYVCIHRRLRQPPTTPGTWTRRPMGARACTRSGGSGGTKRSDMGYGR